MLYRARPRSLQGSRSRGRSSETGYARSCLAVRSVAVDEVEQPVAQLLIRICTENLTFLEQQPLALAAGDAVIGFARFARAVHDAAHDGDGDVPVELADALFNLGGKRDEVDLRSAAGRAGDEAHAARTQPRGLDDGDAGADLLDGVSRQGDADGVADALAQKRADADGGLNSAVPLGAGLGDAEVQGVFEGLGGEAVGCL